MRRVLTAFSAMDASGPSAFVAVLRPELLGVDFDDDLEDDIRRTVSGAVVRLLSSLRA